MRLIFFPLLLLCSLCDRENKGSKTRSGTKERVINSKESIFVYSGSDGVIRNTSKDSKVIVDENISIYIKEANSEDDLIFEIDRERASFPIVIDKAGCYEVRCFKKEDGGVGEMVDSLVFILPVREEEAETKLEKMKSVAELVRDGEGRRARRYYSSFNGSISSHDSLSQLSKASFEGKVGGENILKIYGEEPLLKLKDNISDLPLLAMEDVRLPLGVVKLNGKEVGISSYYEILRGADGRFSCELTMSEEIDFILESISGIDKKILKKKRGNRVTLAGERGDPDQYKLRLTSMDGKQSREVEIFVKNLKASFGYTIDGDKNTEIYYRYLIPLNESDETNVPPGGTHSINVEGYSGPFDFSAQILIGGRRIRCTFPLELETEGVIKLKNFDSLNSYTYILSISGYEFKIANPGAASIAGSVCEGKEDDYVDINKESGEEDENIEEEEDVMSNDFPPPVPRRDRRDSYSSSEGRRDSLAFGNESI